jgi:hypothetical protein
VKSVPKASLWEKVKSEKCAEGIPLGKSENSGDGWLWVIGD